MGRNIDGQPDRKLRAGSILDYLRNYLGGNMLRFTKRTNSSSLHFSYSL